MRRKANRPTPRLVWIIAPPLILRRSEGLGKLWRCLEVAPPVGGNGLASIAIRMGLPEVPLTTPPPLEPSYNARGDYLAFLGRISPEKRPDRAIQIARAVGLPLKIAAKVDRVDETYFHEQIATLLQQPGVEFLGEINERSKSEFLDEALALLAPIDWPEPFGLVMIEAMACGTAVLAFRRGSVEEIVEPDLTGAIVDSVDEAVRALPLVFALSRRRVRAVSSNASLPPGWQKTISRSIVHWLSALPSWSTCLSLLLCSRRWKQD